MKEEMKLVIENTSQKLYQWDTGCRFIVLGADGCNEVHYKSPDIHNALVCKIYEDNGTRVVEVPNILLQSGNPFYAYLCMDSAEDFRTLKAIHVTVCKRAKPEDYIYTQTEVLSYRTLDERIRILEEDQEIDDAQISEGVQKYLQDHPITPESIGALPAENLEEAIEKSLAQAKESGEFKGEKGDPGETGAAGYTPVKGIDYFDGAQGPKGDSGEKGKDGVSVTHSWNGTTLTITSANGTSSVNLKGEKGDTGAQGIQGIQGEPGAKGAKGDKGDTGATGPQGEQGIQGPAGPKGDTGATGPQGPKGDTGATGPQGPAGSNATVTKESIEKALGYVPAGTGTESSLTGKKIVYDGDSICAAAFSYPKLIADKTACIYDNQAVGGARLCSYSGAHSVVDNLVNLPTDGDIYCFQGGINDWWANTPVGTFTQGDYTAAVDATTIYGAMETIFRYALTNFFGKAICFVITHKVQNAAYSKNTAGNTFWDYRKAMIDVCEKYSIPYYDAFTKSGLNGWHTGQKAGLFVSGDGTHPTEAAYEAYYVPQLVSLFESIIPIGDYEAPAKPVTYTNMLKQAVDSDGNPYNGGKGWKADTYLSYDGRTESSSTNYDVTGWIPAKIGDVVRLKNVQLCKTVGTASKCIVATVKSDFSAVSSTNWLKDPSSFTAAWQTVTNEAGTDVIQFTVPTALQASLAYIRLCCGTLTDASVITINELIE